MWLNHVTINTARNGTTTHTVAPATTATVVDGTAFTPTAGRLLVCVAVAAVTSTTPSGWTLPTSGSAVGGMGVYVWWRVAAGGDTFTTTHNGSNYPVVFDFYEFQAGSTFKGSASATAVAFNGGAGPTLSGMTGITLYMAVAGENASTDVSGSMTWSSGIEGVDTFVTRNVTDGYLYGLAYLESAATSWSSAATTTQASNSVDRLVFGIKDAARKNTKTAALQVAVRRSAFY